MINEDRGRYSDSPLTVIGLRRTMATAAAASLAVLGALALAGGAAIGTPEIWNLGLASLIAAAVAGSYAGHLDAARLTLCEQARAAGEDETRAARAGDVERELLAQLAGIAARLDRLESCNDQYLSDLDVLRSRQQHLAGRVADILDDELRQRRRSG